MVALMFFSAAMGGGYLFTKFVLICCQVVGWISTACPHPLYILHLLGWCAYVFAFSCTRRAFEVTSVVFRIALVWGTQDYTKCKICRLTLGPYRVNPKWPERKTGLRSYQLTAHRGFPWAPLWTPGLPIAPHPLPIGPQVALEGRINDFPLVYVVARPEIQISQVKVN